MGRTAVSGAGMAGGTVIARLRRVIFAVQLSGGVAVLYSPLTGTARFRHLVGGICPTEDLPVTNGSKGGSGAASGAASGTGRGREMQPNDSVVEVGKDGLGTETASQGGMGDMGGECLL